MGDKYKGFADLRKKYKDLSPGPSNFIIVNNVDDLIGFFHETVYGNGGCRIELVTSLLFDF